MDILITNIMYGVGTVFYGGLVIGLEIVAALIGA